MFNISTKRETGITTNTFHGAINLARSLSENPKNGACTIHGKRNPKDENARKLMRFLGGRVHGLREALPKGAE